MMLNYKISGKGMPFFFLHGLGSNMAQPQSLLSDVERVQLISADCPGHGQSPLPPNQNPSFDYYAQEIMQLMDELKIKKAILGGISMGAGIALNIALRSPKRVKALVLVRPAWLDMPSPQNLKILSTAAAFIGSPTGADRFEKESKYQSIATLLPLAGKSIKGVFSAKQQKVLPLVLKKMIEDCPFKNIADLKKLVIPSLIIANEEDPLHPYQMAMQLNLTLANSALKKVVSRYVDNRQHKRIVNILVNEFLRTVDGRRP